MVDLLFHFRKISASKKKSIKCWVSPKQLEPFQEKLSWVSKNRTRHIGIHLIWSLLPFVFIRTNKATLATKETVVFSFRQHNADSGACGPDIELICAAHQQNHSLYENIRKICATQKKLRIHSCGFLSERTTLCWLSSPRSQSGPNPFAPTLAQWHHHRHQPLGPN